MRFSHMLRVAKFLISIARTTLWRTIPLGSAVAISSGAQVERALYKVPLHYLDCYDVDHSSRFGMRYLF